MKAILTSIFLLTLPSFISYCQGKDNYTKISIIKKKPHKKKIKKMKLYFVTSNDRKFGQVRKWVHELDPSIEIVRTDCDLPEIQSLNIEDVIISKAQDAWRHLKAPLIVDDSGVYFESYPYFPGTFTKPIFRCLGHQGFWALLKDNPRAWGLHTIAYTDGHDVKLFQAKVFGTFVETSQCEHKQLCTHLGCKFIADGTTHTFTEIEETDALKAYHSRYVAVKQLVSWLQGQPTKS